MAVNRIALYACLLWCFANAAISVGQMRTFTDHTGKYHLRAELAGFDGDVVYLKTSDGRNMEIKFDKLSVADQELVKREFPLGKLSSDLSSLAPRTVTIGSDLDDEARRLADRAKEILKTHCHRCHGEAGTSEGGLGFVLDRAKLIDGDQYIVPGDPHESYLFERVASGEMPEPGEEPRPTADDIEILRQWIAAGAPDFVDAAQRPYIYVQEKEMIIKKDLAAFAERERKFKRYFTLTHLHNAGVPDPQLQQYRVALTKLLNSLSWNRDIARYEPIDPNQTILRVDLRGLSWSSEIWEDILEQYPYGYLTEENDVELFRQALQTELPFVRADWFVAVASRPPLYHAILQIPDTADELETILRVNVETNIANEKVARAGFNRSGVSQHNRMIERHETPYGFYWKSYDFAGSAGRQNLFHYPLGPHDDESSFLHDGGEMIFSLPNGFLGYMLVDADGHRLDAGPTQIVSDPNRPDRKVVNGISCMSCHAGGIIAKADEIRGHVTANRSAFPRSAEILALYPEADALDGIYQQDAELFQSAMRKIGMTDLNKSNEPIAQIARRFEDELNLNQVCAEIGVPQEWFRDRLKMDDELTRGLGQVTVPGGTMKRDAFVQIFLEVVDRFDLGLAVSTATTFDNDFDSGPSLTSAKHTGPFAQIILDLNSGNSHKITMALWKLHSERPSGRIRALNDAVKKLAKEGSSSERRSAITALANIDPKGNRSLILDALDDSDSWVRSSAFAALKKMKDPKTAEQVAKYLFTPNQRDAVAILEAIGAPAEEHLFELLHKGDSWITRKQVAEILGRIGTEKSLSPLRKSLRDHSFVSSAAKKAIAQIQARDD